MTKHQHKERGGWLSAWLILIMIHGVIATLLVLDALKQQYAPSKPLIMASLIFISIAAVIAAIAIWYWKKWGFSFNIFRIFRITVLASISVNAVINPGNVNLDIIG